jgi:UDP-N-acetylglucosamine--N-acetylmuramyl-(pentapeptide) pyrophosphoryl-undecaprenol N-acetylglucosamine transferase
VPKAGFPLELVRAKGLVGKGWRPRLEGLRALPLAFLDSLRLLARHAPRAVVGVGGYASGPLVATAWARRIPTLIHEQNAIPGLTNRILARLARRIAVGTACGAAALPGAIVTGNPVRPAFFEIPSLVLRSKERRLRVLVVGGSQGAEILNRLMPGALARVAARGIAFDVVHQAGKGRAGEVVTAYGKRGLSGDRAFVHEFLDEIAAAYAAADLVVARAGAMTVAEAAAAGRPALLVPFAAATHGHQEANGRALESVGAAVVVTEAEATEESLAAALAGLLGDPLRLLAMGEAARHSAAPDAASRLCDLLFEVEAA